MSADPNCIFCKIVAGQIPSRRAYEDDELLAFHDIHPWAPVHLLVIPKQHIATLSDTGPEHQALLGRMLGLAPRLMAELGVSNGYATWPRPYRMWLAKRASAADEIRDAATCKRLAAPPYH